MHRTAPAVLLHLGHFCATAWLCLACSASDEGGTLDGGGPTGGASATGGSGAAGGMASEGGVIAPDAALPEEPTWQVLDLASLGRIRDVVAVHDGAAAVAVLAAEQGLFRLAADGVTALDAPVVPGGYAAVDFSSTRGLFAIGDDGITLIMGPAAGPYQTTVFAEPTPFLELVASPTGFLGLRGTDFVAIYEHFEGIGVAGVAGLAGVYTALVAEGPRHLAAMATELIAFDASSGEGVTLPDDTAVDGVTTLHLTAEGDVFGGDATGRLIERVGGAWRRLDGPTAGAFRGGDAGPAGVVLVGDGGLVLRRNGDTWVPLPFSRTDDLVDVAATPGEPLLLTADGEVLWYGLPSLAPRLGSPDPDAPDAGPPDAGPLDAGPPPASPPQMRVISLTDGAVLDGCLDRRPFEGPYDRVGNRGGMIASGYQRISAGPHRFQADVYLLPDDRCGAIGDDAEFTAEPGKLYTALIWDLLGFLNVEVVPAEVPVLGGATLARAQGRSEARGGRLTVCIDGEPIPGDFSAIDRPSFTAEVRMASDAPCQGELLGTAPVELTPGAASTLVAYSRGERDDAPHALMTCLDVGPDGALAGDWQCADAALTAP